MDLPSSLSQLSFQCPTCESSFTSKRSLGVHKRAHTLRAARENTAARDSATSPSQPNGQPGSQDTVPNATSSSKQLVPPSVDASTLANTDTASVVITADTSSTLPADSAHVQQPESTALEATSSLAQVSDEHPSVLDPIAVSNPIFRAYLPSFLPVSLYLHKHTGCLIPLAPPGVDIHAKLHEKWNII